MKTTHRIVYTDEYIADAVRVSAAQKRRLKFLAQILRSWWLPRAGMVGLIIYLVLNGFDWSITAWIVAFLILHGVAEWLSRRRRGKALKELRSADPITVSMDENGIDVVSKNGNSHSKWAGWSVPVIYPNGVLLKLSRLSGIWLPDQALVEGSPEDVRQLLEENIKDQEPRK